MKPRPHPDARQGRLVYVIGPSGAGKDSIIAYARARLGGEGSAHVFPRRHITRPVDGQSEDHVSLSPEDFDGLCQAGRFALHWRGNGLCYGIGNEIDLSLVAGRHVIVNGSRAHLPEAARAYPDLLPVAIAIDPGVLRQRLLVRAREQAGQIEDRLKRAAELQQVDHPALRTIPNNGALEEAGESFVALLRSL
jgi:ribose 1,5-bisphosphokinase